MLFSAGSENIPNIIETSLWCQALWNGDLSPLWFTRLPTLDEAV